MTLLIQDDPSNPPVVENEDALASVRSLLAAGALLREGRLDAWAVVDSVLGTNREASVRFGPMDLDDAILLLRDPRLGKRGMTLAAKLAARELGPVLFVDGDEIWNTEKMTTDEEWIAFAQFLRAMVRRRGLGP